MLYLRIVCMARTIHFVWVNNYPCCKDAPLSLRDKHIQRNSLWVRLVTCGLTRVKNWLHYWTFTTKGYYPHNYQFKEAFLVKNSNPLLQQVMEHSTEYGFLGMKSKVWRKNPLVSTFRRTFFLNLIWQYFILPILEHRYNFLWTQ